MVAVIRLLPVPQMASGVELHCNKAVVVTDSRSLGKKDYSMDQNAMVSVCPLDQARCSAGTSSGRFPAHSKLWVWPRVSEAVTGILNAITSFSELIWLSQIVMEADYNDIALRKNPLSLESITYPVGWLPYGKAACTGKKPGSLAFRIDYAWVAYTLSGSRPGSKARPGNCSCISLWARYKVMWCADSSFASFALIWSSRRESGTGTSAWQLEHSRRFVSGTLDAGTCLSKRLHSKVYIGCTASDNLFAQASGSGKSCSLEELSKSWTVKDYLPGNIYD